MPDMHEPEHHETNDCEQTLPPDAATSADNRNPRRRQRAETVEDVGLLVEPGEHDTFENLVLHESAKQDIATALAAIERHDQIESVWQISRLGQNGRCVLNFYGSPGTGKTRSALAIARQLGKPLYQVDYSAVISKYLGDTAKHIALAFRRAAELNAILFFDEADSLLSRRVPMGESCATSINQNRNVLMQCLDRHHGVVIVTTNLFSNYDPALLRRIARHIEFKLPNRAMRRRLLELHLPNQERVEADLDQIAAESRGLSGGDVLNVCVNAIYAASVDPDPTRWRVTETLLKAEIQKIKTARENHTASHNENN